MVETTVYTFEDEDGVEDSYSTQHFAQAYKRALDYKMRLIENTFTWADSEVVADFTSKPVAGFERA